MLSDHTKNRIGCSRKPRLTKIADVHKGPIDSMLAVSIDYYLGKLPQFVISDTWNGDMFDAL